MASGRAVRTMGFRFGSPQKHPWWLSGFQCCYLLTDVAILSVATYRIAAWTSRHRETGSLDGKHGEILLLVVVKIPSGDIAYRLEGGETQHSCSCYILFFSSFFFFFLFFLLSLLLLLLELLLLALFWFLVLDTSAFPPWVGSADIYASQAESPCFHRNGICILFNTFHFISWFRQSVFKTALAVLWGPRLAGWGLVR